MRKTKHHERLPMRTIHGIPPTERHLGALQILHAPVERCQATSWWAADDHLHLIDLTIVFYLVIATMLDLFDHAAVLTQHSIHFAKRCGRDAATRTYCYHCL